ncbi:hypothetical protein ACN38_g5516 [Penicillium nordicum]|uniref:Splicing factor YJU2 n=1 Tax=Penicillium nordicum TaxID=229535 RepID=A0A0M8PA76_9EURO|nr:hypothetical protein ACN38_g5516 [Penicillium nordicum]
MGGGDVSVAQILERVRREGLLGPEHVTAAAEPAQPVARQVVLPQGPLFHFSHSSFSQSSIPSNSVRDNSNMAERKVLSKYYPPDFDPSAIEQKKRSGKDGKAVAKVATIRLMTPFSMRCTHCGQHIPKGRKFNSRKELAEDKYMGSQVYRFYIRCIGCSGEITFCTDPKNRDYRCERGATRNFEVWRDDAADKYKDETEEQTIDRLEKEHGAEEEQLKRDKMADLEDKMHDSKREMEIADAIDGIRTRNARMERTETHGDKAAMATVQQKIDEEALRRAKAEEEEDRKALEGFREKQRAAKSAALDAQIEREEAERKAFQAQYVADMHAKRLLVRERMRARKAKEAAAKAKEAEAKAKALTTPSANRDDSAAL